MKGYENDYKRCDQLHNIKIRELKTPYIRDFINTLKTKTGTSASDGTKKKTKIFISNLLQFALENELINRNVASFTMNNLKGKVKEKNIFTNEEIKELWELSKSYYFARVILVMIYTGLRISEIRGLKRESINILQGTIINSGIKTEKGKNRTIFIHKDIKPVIMELIQESKNDYLIYGDFKIKAREKNKSVSKTYFEKNFKEICNILGVVHTPHDTRHTFTTILYRNGLKDKYIIDLVGHTDIKMTESNYIHLERKELQDSLNNIDFKVN